MPNYAFETITPAQALGFSSTSDNLAFGSSGVSAANVSLAFDPSGADVVVTETTTGRSVTFGSGFFGEKSAAFPDGSELLVGGANADFLRATGSTGAIWGGPGDDMLVGGAGNHTLVRGAGRDVLAGAGGNALFVIQAGSSPLDGYDRVEDWQAHDSVTFGGPAGSSANLVEATAADVPAAIAYANQAFAAGTLSYVAVEVSAPGAGGLYLFSDDRNDGRADDVVLLQQANASNFGAANVVASDLAPPLPEPAIPPPPSNTGEIDAHGTVVGNMDQAHIGQLLNAYVEDAEQTQIQLAGNGASALLNGEFSYSGPGDLIATGPANYLDLQLTGLHLTANIPPTDALQLLNWVAADATQPAFASIFGGNDQLTGSASADLIRGYGGNDTLSGGGGDDTLYGGDGADVIYAGVTTAGSVTTANTYLRGEAGDDYIKGGAGFDDINGNQGNDTIVGVSSVGDWLVGGQGNDVITAATSVAHNILYGNLGNDTLQGGSGGDTLRGGQGDDSIVGGVGADWISGDRGDDTVTGGAGADTFHSGPGMGITYVTDFNPSEGDRVQLDAGSTAAITQSGADVRLDLGGGTVLVLQHTQLSALPSGWLFYA